MTEAEWLNEVRPTGLLSYLRERAAQRKVILFNCACCRRVWKYIGNEDRLAVAEFEANADDPVAIAELDHRYEPPPPRLQTLHTDGGVATYVVFEEQPASAPGTNLRARLAQYRGWSISGVAFAATNLAAGEPEGGRHLRDVQSALRRYAEPSRVAEDQEQTRLVRDIFGNPFRPVVFSPDWRTSTAIAIAQQMYESRDFSAMPILADALQDAGCDNDDILNHCRDANGVHVRGCWVVDLVLDKE